MFDVAIIGAGIAGLACAQQLRQAGYSVVIVEKSRGVGGRMATRRLGDTCADHGIRYLEAQGKWLPSLIEVLRQRSILQVWQNQDNQYVAPAGMTAVAKFLSKDLEIWLNRRVEAITPTAENTWHLTLNSPDTTYTELTAKAIILAIPAPQALTLLDPLEKTLPPIFLDSLNSVKFDPCITVMAGYQTEQISLPNWQQKSLANHPENLENPDLGWISLDSSKRLNPKAPIFVLQSTADFANRYLDTEDLKPVAQELLSKAALLIPGLDEPEWLQVHRWRYAFPKLALSQNYLYSATPLPLICCGDWCGGNLIDGAMNSGVAAAEKLNQQLQQHTLPGAGYLDSL